MSHYICPNCQYKTYIFGKDGATNVAKEMDLEVLGNNLQFLFLDSSTQFRVSLNGRGLKVLCTIPKPVLNLNQG